MSTKVTPHAFSLPPGDEYGHRLVVDLESPEQAAAAEMMASLSDLIGDKSTAAAPATDASQVATPRPPGAATPATPSSAPPQQAAQLPAVPSPHASGKAAKPIVVAVDAGHGGEDSGARGPNGLREKDVALSIARKLARLINGEPGMKAVLTRDGDYYIGLRQRTQKARRHQADLFVSVHADAFRDRSASGSSVYVVSQRGASSEHARSLAERENAADLVGGVRLTGRDDRDAFLLSVLQDTSMEASFDIAGRLLRELKGVNNLHKHDVQQAGFMVLKSPDIPSVLVETAFISNRQEAALLGSQAYQDKLANALLKGVRGYFSNYRPGRTVAEADTDTGITRN
jgi:N-acetylmuramoyl-L-alanine amidase